MTRLDELAADTPAATPIGRTRTMGALFTAAALMTAAMSVASAAGSIVAADRLGAAWGGVPATAGIVGTGIGSLLLTRAMRRRGRRSALAYGYLAAVAGATLAVNAVLTGDVAGLTAGMLLLGLGNAAAQLSRYAAADLYPPQRRATAISTVVWAGAVGAVGGPLLLGPSGGAATGLDWSPLAGPFLLAAATTAIAVLAVTVIPVGASAPAAELARRPVEGPIQARGGGRVEVPAEGAAEGSAKGAAVPIRELIRTPTARSALAVMATAQVVMVAVMTAAPVHLHQHGEGLGSVGALLAGHTLGMFALSPVTGRLVDRYGARPVMLAGLGTLLLATGLAAVAADVPAPRAIALTLLGYGWNLCFVGGSGRLARDLPAAERTRVEGGVDAAVWGVAAVAGLTSTAVLSAGGYGLLAGAAAVIVLLAGAFLLGRDRQP
jgi:MFS family permease